MIFTTVVLLSYFELAHLTDARTFNEVENMAEERSVLEDGAKINEILTRKRRTIIFNTAKSVSDQLQEQRKETQNTAYYSGTQNALSLTGTINKMSLVATSLLILIHLILD